MRSMTSEMWGAMSQLYAFLGNSLLEPMSRTKDVGLNPEFWRGLGGLCEGALAAPAEALAVWAERASVGTERPDLVRRVSLEYAKLFVGPPRPAAAPWESTNGDAPSHVGFGEATFAMRERLRAHGLALCNENNQYEDHMGIELLYLSELCRRAGAELAMCEDAGAQSDTPARVAPAPADSADAAFVVDFAREHPLAWIERFRESVGAACPDGYYVRLLDFAESALAWQVA